MKLSEVMENIEVAERLGTLEPEVSGLKLDSREVRHGDVFFALSGVHQDGRRYVARAVEAGAIAVVFEGRLTDLQLKAGATYIAVEDARKALALMACNYHGRPSEHMQVLGITGTNGKTTSAHLTKAILQRSGRPAGLVGTIDYQIGETRLPSRYTTPEAPEFQSLLRAMREAGCTHVVSEVSSHALAQRRVDGTIFRVAALTNLTRDHLDYHGSMDKYLSAKRRLFDELLQGTAVINVDDPAGAKLAASYKQGAGLLSFGVTSKHALMRATNISSTAEGLGFNINFEGATHAVASPLVGMVNVYNILTAAALCLSAGLSWVEVEAGISGFAGVAGRFQRIEAGQKFLCIVDYAHTEDALRRLMTTARQFTTGKLITVFGCGGERDRGKRPAMTEAATTLSDFVYITSDNPRGESLEAILADMLEGAKGDTHKVIPDRNKAIRAALASAGTGDTVLVAGKGHEEYQEIKGKRVHFSDAETAREHLAELTGDGKAGEGEGHGTGA